MRILCLHGKGTSGHIFKSQTSSFRAHLPPTVSFDFIDAPIPSSPAPGIDLFYPPPYYAFWDDASLASITASTEWLSDLLANSDPYDAVMCFSQGCYLAAATLLLHQVNHPDQPPPFKSAIFICGGAPLLLAESLGFEIGEEIWTMDRVGRDQLARQADSGAILAKGAERWVGSGPASDAGKLDEEALRSVMQGPVRIEIPTVHVYGEKDPRYTAGVLLSGLCAPERRRVFNHGGGHEIPRTSAVSGRIAELVEWVLREGDVGC